ncbi:hypothetical protein B0H14DRAFT_3563032 [Mycena olivaceomarginata]|nr:hypothetical protein B0H14DRAFT_3563032 [Mycena olivaceomarginata]
MASSPHTTTTAGQLGPTTGAIYCTTYGPDFYRSFGNFPGDKGYGAAEFRERFGGGVEGAGDGGIENKAGNYKATPRNLSTWEIDRMVDEAEKYKARIRLNTPVDTGYTPAVRTPKQADKRFMAHDILRALGKTPLDESDRVQYAKRRAMESSQVEEEPVVMARISSNESSVKSTPPTSPSGRGRAHLRLRCPCQCHCRCPCPLAAGTATTDTFVLASLATDNVHEMSQVTTVAICKTHF